MKKMLLMLLFASATISGADNNSLVVEFKGSNLTAAVMQEAWDSVRSRMRHDTVVAFDCTSIRRIDQAAFAPLATPLAQKIKKMFLFGEALQECDASDFQQLQNTELNLYKPSLDQVKIRAIADHLRPKISDMLKSSALPFYIGYYCANILLAVSAGTLMLEVAEYNGCKKEAASLEANDCAFDVGLPLLGSTVAGSLSMLASGYYKHVYREYYPNKFFIKR